MIYDKLSQNIINADHKAFYPFRGTPLFASVDAHQRKLLTKRSDLISLIFAVLYGMDKNLLPWNKKDVLNVMQLKKQRFVKDIDKYLKSRKFPKELLNIMHHIIGLKYHEIPDYQYIKSLLESLLTNIDTKLIKCGPKQIEFLNYLKDECYKEYKYNINKMDIDY